MVAAQCTSPSTQMPIYTNQKRPPTRPALARPHPGGLMSRPPGRHGPQQLRGRRGLPRSRLDGRRLLAQLRAQLSAADAPSHGAQDPFLADVDGERRCRVRCRKGEKRVGVARDSSGGACARVDPSHIHVHAHGATRLPARSTGHSTKWESTMGNSNACPARLYLSFSTMPCRIESWSADLRA